MSADAVGQDMAGPIEEARAMRERAGLPVSLTSEQALSRVLEALRRRHQPDVGIEAA